MNLVQVRREDEWRTGIVDGDRIVLLSGYDTTYSLACEAVAQNVRMAFLAQDSIGREVLDYDAVYSGRSEWRLGQRHRPDS